MQDVVDRYAPPAAPSLGDFGPVLCENNATTAAGFVVKGGPWEQRAPDTASTHEFPTMRGAGGGGGGAGGAAGADPPTVTGATPWGPRR